MGTVDIGIKYEEYCMTLLEAKGYTDISGTKTSGDQGIDIVAFRDNVKFGFQCKYYSSPVGNHAVQEAFAGAKFYGCNVAVVITNSVFTDAAKGLANNTGVVLWEKIEMKSSASEIIPDYYNVETIPNYSELFPFYRSLSSLDVYTNLFLTKDWQTPFQAKIRLHYRNDSKQTISVDIRNSGEKINILRLQRLGFQYNTQEGNLFIVILNDDPYVESINYPDIYLPIITQKPYHAKHMIYRPNMKPLQISVPYILNNKRVIKGAGLSDNDGKIGDVHTRLLSDG